MATKIANRVLPRAFDKKFDGISRNIGSVVLRIVDHVWSLDGTVLPESSVEHLMGYALQSLLDSYAGAENLADAQNRFAARYEKLVNGTLGVRGSGGVDSFTKVARSVVHAYLRQKKADLWKEINDLAKDDKKAATDRLDAIFAKNEAALRPLVEKEIEKRQREAAEAKAAADEIDIDLD